MFLTCQLIRNSFSICYQFQWSKLHFQSQILIRGRPLMTSRTLTPFTIASIFRKITHHCHDTIDTLGCDVIYGRPLMSYLTLYLFFQQPTLAMKWWVVYPVMSPPAFTMAGPSWRRKLRSEKRSWASAGTPTTKTSKNQSWDNSFISHKTSFITSYIALTRKTRIVYFFTTVCHLEFVIVVLLTTVQYRHPSMWFLQSITSTMLYCVH